MTIHRAIYGARRALGLDDDTARDLYERETGKRSLSDMTAGEHELVLAALVRAQGASDRRGKRLDGPYAAKLQALWLDGWHLGVIRNRHDAALLAFVEGQTKISHTRFLRDANDARKAVEALKSWLARAGGVEWGKHADPVAAVIAAQRRILGMPDDQGVPRDRTEKIGLMRTYGRLIRQAAGVE